MQSGTVPHRTLPTARLRDASEGACPVSALLCSVKVRTRALRHHTHPGNVLRSERGCGHTLLPTHHGCMYACRDKAISLRWRSSGRHRRETAFQYIRHMWCLTSVRHCVSRNCISLYALHIKHASPSLRFLQHPRCRLWYDALAQAYGGQAPGREETGWTLSRWSIKRSRCRASGAA